MKKFLLVLSGVFFIASCGWEPMYAERTKKSFWYFDGEFDSSVADEMTQIKVETISGRFGQQIRNNLLDNLTPRGVPSQPRYRLHVKVFDKSVWKQALQEDITATRERVQYKVQYRLSDGENDLVTGDSIAFVSYDILKNPYSTTMAMKKSETRAARIIADDIALRIGAYFHTVHTGR